jgi:zinc/manganese transport system substrate-binding protein
MLKRVVIACMMLLAFGAVVPISSALTVVSTTTALYDPMQYIGGEKVEAVYISEPTICPHMQQDVINNRIQMHRDFIATADLFVAHNGSVDKDYVMPFVDDFMVANGYGEVQWVTPDDPAMTWNTPAKAEEMAGLVKGWLITADPANRSYYEERYASYLDAIASVDLTDKEREQIAGQDVIVMVWQQDAVENWLGMNVIAFYAPEFYQGGKYTAAKLVEDIHAHPDTYANVTYVIENMQSGELGKGIEEALHDEGIDAQRVIFTNFPKSVQNVEDIPDVLDYNKHLVMAETTGASPEQTQQAPLSSAVCLLALSVSLLMLAWRYRK